MVADGYLFTVVDGAGFAGIDLANRPAIKTFVGRVAARPAARATKNAV
jgi:glutathione S-transferase